MSSGALVATVVAIATMPIISRIYDEEHFGVFAIFVSVVTIFGSCISLFYPFALIIPKFKTKFYSLLSLCLKLTILGSGLAVLISITALIFRKSIEIENMAILALCFPIAVLASELNKILFQWNSRDKDFKKNSISTFSNKLVNRVGNILFSIGGTVSSLGLVIPYVIGFIVSIVILYRKGMSKVLSYIRNRHEANSVAIAKEYINYPKYILPSNLINRFSADMPLYFLALYFDSRTTGAFAFALSLLNIPYNVIGNALSSVFHQKANEYYLKDNLKFKNFVKEIHLKLLLLGLVPFAIIYTYGDVLFVLVFGENWELAGKMASYLSLYFAFRIISAPIAKVFTIIRKEHYTLYYNISLSLLRVVFLILGLQFDNPLIAVAFFSIGNLLGYLVVNFMIFAALKFQPIKRTIVDISYFTLIFGVVYLTRALLDGYLFI